MIARVYGPKHKDGGEYAPLVETTNHADARLIAAAPELLDALQSAYDHISTAEAATFENGTLLGKIGRVLAKATGEETT